MDTQGKGEEENPEKKAAENQEVGENQGTALRAGSPHYEPTDSEDEETEDREGTKNMVRIKEEVIDMEAEDEIEDKQVLSDLEITKMEDRRFLESDKEGTKNSEGERETDKGKREKDILTKIFRPSSSKAKKQAEMA